MCCLPPVQRPACPLSPAAAGGTSPCCSPATVAGAAVAWIGWPSTAPGISIPVSAHRQREPRGEGSCEGSPHSRATRGGTRIISCQESHVNHAWIGWRRTAPGGGQDSHECPPPTRTKRRGRSMIAGQGHPPRFGCCVPF